MSAKAEMLPRAKPSLADNSLEDTIEIFGARHTPTVILR
jgi:hypothetical protein